MTSHPPPQVVARAELVAEMSPCRKSRRGVVAYAFRDGSLTPKILGEGYNGSPLGTCDGSEACRRDCSKRCVHAESRALRNALGRVPYATFYLLHVRIGQDGTVAAGGGPSCWQCSREILDAGNVAGMWLLEATTPDAVEAWDRWYRGEADADRPAAGEWRYYTAEEFHRATIAACGIGGPR